MEQMNLEKTIKSLDLYRTSFINIFDSTNRLLSEEPLNYIEVRSNVQVLEQKMMILKQLHEKYIDTLLEEDSEDVDLDAEMAKIDDFTCKFTALKLKVDACKFDTTKRTEPQSSRQNLRCLHPRIEFRKFGGDIREWLSFWSQFKRYHEDEMIPNEEKLQLLIQATTPNSRARHIVESYPPVGENYPKVIETMKKRFGKKDLQIEVYVRELLKLILTNVNKPSKINILYDSIEAQLRSLETLGVTSDTCAAMLFPLVESCLPEDLLRIWERSTSFKENDTSKVRLEHLMDFLRKEVESEERVILASTSFTDKVQRKDVPKEIPTATGLLSSYNQKVRCVFCSQEHNSGECPDAAKLSLVERKKILSKKGRCHACMKFGHIAPRCKTAQRLKCESCHGKHITLMCPKGTTHPLSINEPNVKEPIESLSNLTVYEGFLQTLMVNLKGKDSTRLVRAIFDTGSHRSYITTKAAQKMGYDIIRREEMVHALFGGLSSDIISHNCYRVVLDNPDNKYSCSFEALDEPVICSNVLGLRPGPWISELETLKIKVHDNSQAPIEILIGADIAGKLYCGQNHILNSGLVAMQTKLGWTLMGKVPVSPDFKMTTRSMTSLSLLTRSKSSKLSDLWTLDILGIESPADKISTQEHNNEIINRFLETVKRDSGGRYEVSLPWIQGHRPLSDNYDIAKKRLDNLMLKLEKDGYYNEYENVLQDWLQEGVIERVNEDELKGAVHYLPHRHVVKLSSSTTKLRPVFDASAKGKDSPSLNQCLEKGINMLTLIPSLLINFRKEKIGVISDIRKAFLQINLDESDRDFLRFLWYDKDANLITFRHVRVVFGVSSSPFLLNAVIKHHLNQIFQEHRPDVSDNLVLNLMKSFYVDNCVTSVDTREQLNNFMRISTDIFREAQFDLRMWEFTAFDDDKEVNYLSSVLGMTWNRKSDTLHLCLENLKHIDTSCITKRIILSVTNRIFDPLGIVSPVLLLPKLLLQRTWVRQLKWNCEVSEDIKVSFIDWLNNINYLSFLAIPRWFFTQKPQDSHLSIHVFSDASQDAYAAVIFIRCEMNSIITVQLMQAKSRVSPAKKLSIPRLELLAATIAARLYTSVQDCFDDHHIPVHFWTDSTTVLFWIKRKENWKPFVWNRVEEIRKLTKEGVWKYVPGPLNPADLPSRGCTASQLLHSCWWEGPDWLHKTEEFWPKQEYEVDQNTVICEQSKSSSSLLLIPKTEISWAYRKYSKYEKIIRLICWVRRFIHNVRNRGNRRYCELSVEERSESELMLLRAIQQESFPNNVLNKIMTITLVTDENNIIRVKTKILERNDSELFRFPILLPAKHPVTTRLIFDTHCKMYHVGVQILMSTLRETYWIMGGRKTVKSAISKCGVCRKFEAKRMNAPPIALPLNRVKDSAVFEVTGVDLFGPLYLRQRRKVWAAIFTCAVYRAVHLELVSSLSTESFVNALQRFIARRGRPSTIYSDNQTNFRCCSNMLKNLDWVKVQEICAVERIEWKFNPPTAAWWGGWWEVLIRLIKRILIKILGKATLTYEELETVLFNCEAIINARPLTYVSEDIEDLSPLTPKMFLQDIQQTGIVDIENIEASYMRRRCEYKKTLKDSFQKRFRSEYLGQLMMRKNKNPYNKQIKVGELVLVENESDKRLNWPLARVLDVVYGRDGNIRVCKLKTQSGVIMRPIQRLHSFELEEKGIENPRNTLAKNSLADNTAGHNVTTRSGRKIIKPRRLDL